MKRALLMVIVLFWTQPLFAQSVKEIEDSVAFYLTGIQQYSGYGAWREGENDTLDFYNCALLSYLEKNLEKQPLTLEAKFPGVEKLGMRISTSADKKFRIYSWSIQSGGTMQGFNSIFQFKAEKNVCVKILYKDTLIQGEWTGPGFFYPKVYSVQAKNGSTYYLAIRDAIYSSRDVSTGIQAFVIENNNLNDSVKIFKTSRAALNSIDCEYNYFSNYNYKTRKENHLIHLSEDNQKLYIPIVNNEKMTSKYLVYKFDGNNYVFDKNVTK